MNINKKELIQKYELSLKSALNSEFDVDFYNTKVKLYPNMDSITTFADMDVFQYKTYIKRLRKEYYNLCLEQVDTQQGSISWFNGDWELLGNDFFDKPEKPEKIVYERDEYQNMAYETALKNACSRMMPHEFEKVPRDLPIPPKDEFYFFCNGHLVVCKDEYILENGRKKKTGRFLIVKSYEQIMGLPLKYIDVSDSFLFKLCNTQLEKLCSDQMSIDSNGNVLSDKDRKNKNRAYKRAIDRCYDICLCNDWSYMFTGTFSEEKVGKCKPQLVFKKLQSWLQNQVYRKGLKYLLIAEYGEKNGRLHFHGFINDALSLTDSGTVKHPGFKPMRPETAIKKGLDLEQCVSVYNVDEWSKRFGFTTCVPIAQSEDDKIRVTRYMLKYITKDCEKIFGKYYWSSRNVVREPPIFLYNMDFNIIGGEVYNNGCVRFKYESNFSRAE